MVATNKCLAHIISFFGDTNYINHAKYIRYAYYTYIHDILEHHISSNCPGISGTVLTPEFVDYVREASQNWLA